MFIFVLFILSGYEVTQEVKGFRPIERFTVEYLFLLVVDTAETTIKYLFKSICNLVQVCRFSIPLEHFLWEEKGYYNLS